MRAAAGRRQRAGRGAAEDWSHVGILRVLEELHVPIDYIAGTSVGAIVGGMYAPGMTPDEIERALTTIDWRDALADRTRYKDLAYRRKEDDNRYLTVFEAGLQRGRLVLPGGLQSGQKLLDQGDLAESIRASMSIPGVRREG